ncbi:BnaC05g32690D [Brassica napus]|uniref:BnaC05g32690D protein n=1 Tax=Brassica napus TaxID=3708 RepID=A0A078GDK0_BRANA|nr:BnaC05g32690D [Brassica napus]
MIACFVPNQVTYETTGFLQKNRDLLHLDSIQLLSSCSCHLPQAFASSMLIQSEKPVVGPLYKAGGADSQRLSVATKFKGQLFQLMQRLGNTTPQFIGCIMPNNVQSSGLYEQGLAKMLWGHRSGSNLTVWISYKSVSSEICQKIGVLEDTRNRTLHGILRTKALLEDTKHVVT